MDMKKILPWIIGGVAVYWIIGQMKNTSVPGTTEGKVFVPERRVDAGPTLRGIRKNVSL